MLKLAFMAGTQELDTGQFLAYLFTFLLPLVIHSLLLQAIPRDPFELKFLCKALVQGQSWTIRGPHRPRPRKKVKRYKRPSVSLVREGEELQDKLRTHLFSTAMVAFRVGCRIEHFLRVCGRLGPPPRISQP